VTVAEGTDSVGNYFYVSLTAGSFSERSKLQIYIFVHVWQTFSLLGLKKKPLLKQLV